MTSTEKNKHWAQAREVGTLLGFQFLLLIHKAFGRFIFALFLWPALAYFVAFKAAPRKASLQYLRRVHLLSPELFSGKPNIRHVILHFFHFGNAVLDKLLAWSTNLSEDDFLVKDTRELEALMSDERGQLIIGSHFGNLEYCRGFVHRYKTKVINVLLYDQHAANYVRMMQKVNPNSRVNLYQVTDLDVPTILSLKK